MLLEQSNNIRITLLDQFTNFAEGFHFNLSDALSAYTNQLANLCE